MFDKKIDRNAKELKKITQQIHNKNIPIYRHSNHLSSNNNSTREQSYKNKTNQNICNETEVITQLNFTAERINHNHC